MRLFKLFLSLAACLCIAAHALPSDAPNTHVYTGTLGNQSIVMEIGAPSEGRIDGSYFYNNHHRDLPLSAISDKPGHLLLTEGPDNADEHPIFDLSEQPDHGWSGTWRSPKGKTFNVLLHLASIPPPAPTADHYLRDLYSKDLYEYLRLSGLVLRPGRSQTFMGHRLQWWVEPDSKITLFEILDGYPNAQRQRINQVLRDRLWNEVNNYHDCMAGGIRSAESEYSQTITPNMMTANIVSISVFTGYYCGGAHPDFGDVPINLDAHTAHDLALEDVLWLGKGPAFYCEGETGGKNPLPPTPQTPRASFDVFSSYRNQTFSPWLVKQFTALYPAHLEEDDCDYSDSGVWNFPEWHFTPKGIFFTPSFARVVRACEANANIFVLPYATIRKHPGRLHLTLP